MRKTGIVWAMLLAFLPSLGMAAESQVDKLVAKLVQKGILTQEEATELKQEVALEAKQETGSVEQGVKSEVPEWVKNIKLTGDFRVRDQVQHRVGDASLGNTRNLVRMRARLGLETRVNDQFKMAIGIATNGGAGNNISNAGTATADNVNTNPRATNITFDHGGSKGTAVLNYAYGQYTPDDQWTLTGGQMKNPIWEPMEFLWDADITPTGGAVQYNHKVGDAWNVFALGTGFMVKEIALSAADPLMWGAQAGVKGKLLGDKVDLKLAGLYQGIENKTKVPLDNRPTGSSTITTTSFDNSIVANGDAHYIYRYNIPVGQLEIGYNDPFGHDLPVYIPRVGLFGEYAKNPNPDDENTAWMAGAYMGHSTVADKGAWKVTWAYKSIGKDAWLDVLPDSDFYSGGTDVKGYEAILEYGLAKNVTFAVDYYHTQRKSSRAGAKSPESLLQTDINLKF